ncbi:MAG: dienelactone hydrolase family protein [Chitinophagaceae bacterium]|nr:dienelactone hydrolase family protein [Oligoflexus sp.]
MKWNVGVLSAAAMLVSAAAMSAVKSNPVSYKKGADSFEGLVVYPDTVKGKAPAILMLPNWMGVTEETKTQATRFANLGYIVFAADIYGKDHRPKNADEAGKMVGAYKSDRKLYRDRILLGLEQLKKQTNVDASKIAAVGYCFGGTGVIELARTGNKDVKSVLSFHGGLDSPTPADGKNIKAHVIAFHGADDPYEKPEDFAAFQKEMRDNKIDWELVQFGNAVHSFTEKGAGTDNSKGAAYNENADKRSFADAERFLKDTL